jgi:hypothetical protein
MPNGQKFVKKTMEAGRPVGQVEGEATEGNTLFNKQFHTFPRAKPLTKPWRWVYSCLLKKYETKRGSTA